MFERDLEAIGEAAAKGPVSVGASGLGLGLARAFARGRGAERGAALEPVGGLAAILAGSCSRATLDQIAAAEGAIPTLRLSPQKLIEDKAEATRALAWAKERVAAGPVLIASSAEPDDVAALQARFGREASGQAIEAALAEIAAGLVRNGRAAARRRGRRDVRRGGRPARRQRLPARAGDRARRAADAHDRARRRRDADGAQVRQFRRARTSSPARWP